MAQSHTLSSKKRRRMQEPGTKARQLLPSAAHPGINIVLDQVIVPRNKNLSKSAASVRSYRERPYSVLSHKKNRRRHTALKFHEIICRTASQVHVSSFVAFAFHCNDGKLLTRFPTRCSNLVGSQDCNSWRNSGNLRISRYTSCGPIGPERS